MVQRALRAGLGEQACLIGSEEGVQLAGDGVGCLFLREVAPSLEHDEAAAGQQCAV